MGVIESKSCCNSDLRDRQHSQNFQIIEEVLMSKYDINTKTNIKNTKNITNINNTNEKVTKVINEQTFGGESNLSHSNDLNDQNDQNNSNDISSNSNSNSNSINSEIILKPSYFNHNNITSKQFYDSDNNK